MKKLKRFALLYLVPWAVFFLASLITDADGTSLAERLVVTAVLACVVPLLYAVTKRGEKNKAVYTVYHAGSTEPVVRVDGEWIYRGADEKASWYRKKNGIHDFRSMDPVCLIRDNKVYRPDADAPFLTLDGDKVFSCPEGELLYELRK